MIASLLVIIAALAMQPSGASAQLQLGLQDPALAAPSTSSGAAAYRLMRTMHASVVRIGVAWGQVAPSGQGPGGKVPPANFTATNPGDPKYRWTAIDAAVRAAASQHQSPLLLLHTAPSWAQASNKPAGFTASWNPDASMFGQFAEAVARRYGGQFPDPLSPGANLPRAKLFEIWNEQNLPLNLGAPDLVSAYRSLLNAAYSGIKAVHQDDTVAVGGLAPVGYVPHTSIRPLTFVADLLCLRRAGGKYVRAPSCPSPAHFDTLAVHPYSLAATPTLHALTYGDVLVADMGRLASLVNTAEKLNTVAPKIHHPLWVTEWSWFTNPPDTVVGDPPATAARYTAYSVYAMWKAGVSLLIWYRITDESTPLTPSALIYGGGLLDPSGRPKPMFTAFEFPVIASVRHHKGYVWGRAPVSRRTTVVVSHKTRRGWRRVATVRTGRDGVFQARFSARGNGTYRARVPHGAISLGYYSKAIPARRTHVFSTG
jgi:hypothetical protein